MQNPPVKHIRAALDLIKELDTIKPNCTETFDLSSQAASENIIANRSGMDSTVDLVSIPGARLHLHLKLYAAREHLLACIYLVGSNAERTLVNPIQGRQEQHWKLLLRPCGYVATKSLGPSV